MSARLLFVKKVILPSSAPQSIDGDGMMSCSLRTPQCKPDTTLCVRHCLEFSLQKFGFGGFNIVTQINIKQSMHLDLLPASADPSSI